MENAYDFLGNKGKLFWNVGDIRVTNKIIHPLEQDSIKIAEDIGFTHKETIKMLMRNFPGRDVEEKMKKMVEAGYNFIKTGDRWVKFEPVFHFSKE